MAIYQGHQGYLHCISDTIVNTGAAKQIPGSLNFYHPTTGKSISGGRNQSFVLNNIAFICMTIYYDTDNPLDYSNLFTYSDAVPLVTSQIMIGCFQSNTSNVAVTCRGNIALYPDQRAPAIMNITSSQLVTGTTYMLYGRYLLRPNIYR